MHIKQLDMYSMSIHYYAFGAAVEHTLAAGSIQVVVAAFVAAASEGFRIPII